MVKFHADKVKKMIEATGMSVREFAIRNRITPGTLGMWLRGDRNPKLKNIEQLARIFRCSISDLSDFDPMFEINIDDYQLNQEHYGADVANETHQLRQLEKTINDPNYPEDYKKAAKQQAQELRAGIDMKIAAAKRRFEQPSDSPGSTPPFPGTVHPPHEVAMVEQSRLKQIPIMGFAQAAGYDPALEPIVDFVRNNSDETAEFLIDGPTDGYFALTVDGDSMSPEYPHGTRLLVAGNEYPQRGDVVVALLRTGQVIVKDYWRKNNIITLSSENQNGQNFEWNCKEDPGYVLWMKPVIKVELDLRRRRWERTQAGI